MGELSLSVESLFGLHSRIIQLTYLKTQLTASPVDSKTDYVIPWSERKSGKVIFVQQFRLSDITKKGECNMQNEHESTDIIRIDHLNKTFGDVKAVNDLSFRVKKGECSPF